MYFETKLRSVTKGISWRFFATTTTIIIVYMFFGRLDLAIVAGFFETIAKIILYYFHERIWNKVKFGRKEISPIIIYVDCLNSLVSNKVLEEVLKIFKRNQLPINILDAKDFSTFNTYGHLERLVNKLYGNNISLLIQSKDLSSTLFEHFKSKPLNIIDVKIVEDIEKHFEFKINGDIIPTNAKMEVTEVVSLAVDNITHYIKKNNS